MSQAAEFVELFVEQKIKSLVLQENLNKMVVGTGLPCALKKPSEKSSNYVKFQSVFEGNTALYRTALRSKLTATYRYFNTLFVELLLNSVGFHSGHGIGLFTAKFKTTNSGKTPVSFITDGTTDHSKALQESSAGALLGATNGERLYQNQQVR